MKILNTSLICYLTRNSIIFKHQYGFQEAVSTQDAIVCLTKSVYNSIDKQKPSLDIFLDLAKAFDTYSIYQLQQLNMAFLWKLFWALFIIYRNNLFYLENRSQILHLQIVQLYQQLQCSYYY